MTPQGRQLGHATLDLLAEDWTVRKVQEALTGRIELLRLSPLAQAEIESAEGNLVDALFAASPPRVERAPIGRAAFADRIAAGGYPRRAIAPAGGATTGTPTT